MGLQTPQVNERRMAEEELSPFLKYFIVQRSFSWGHFFRPKFVRPAKATSGNCSHKDQFIFPLPRSSSEGREEEEDLHNKSLVHARTHAHGSICPLLFFTVHWGCSRRNLIFTIWPSKKGDESRREKPFLRLFFPLSQRKSLSCSVCCSSSSSSLFFPSFLLGSLTFSACSLELFYARRKLKAFIKNSEELTIFSALNMQNIWDWYMWFDRFRSSNSNSPLPQQQKNVQYDRMHVTIQQNVPVKMELCMVLIRMA